MNKIHQQIVNCTALMAGLASLSDANYDHSEYTTIRGSIHCAGGWAAYWGIGGLVMEENATFFNPSVRTYSSDHILDPVFGEGAWAAFFCGGAGPKKEDTILLIAQHINRLSERLNQGQSE